METGEVEVTYATKQILAVTTTVVHDRVSKEIADGQVVSTEG